MFTALVLSSQMALHGPVSLRQDELFNYTFSHGQNSHTVSVLKNHVVNTIVALTTDKGVTVTTDRKYLSTAQWAEFSKLLSAPEWSSLPRTERGTHQLIDEETLFARIDGKETVWSSLVYEGKLSPSYVRWIEKMLQPSKPEDAPKFISGDQIGRQSRSLFAGIAAQDRRLQR